MNKGVKRKDHIVLGIAVLFLIVILFLSYFTPIGVLFKASNPDNGIYGYSLNAFVRSETLNIKGLYNPVKIIIDKNGVYHIYASNLHDLFLAFGFIQAENRLFQLDLIRRASIGNLSPILGSSYQSSDLFQLKIGNLITAEKDWNETLILAKTNKMANQTVMMLEAYSQGVNDYISYAEAHNELPFEFVLLNYKPQPWTPIDTFLVQQYMAESLEFGDDALILSLMYYKMGNLTNKVIQPFSPIPQVYYAGYNGNPNETITKEIENIWPINSSIAQMAYQLYNEWDPPFINPHGHSNEFVVSGNKTSTTYPILVGGPVLGFSLPFIWFEAQIESPGFDAFGVFLPGLPIPVIGFNQYIAWTLTDVQSISWGTYFFIQTVNNTDYYFNKTWYPIEHYYVNGVELNWTNWGPIMIEKGNIALVMDWLANNYSNDPGVLLSISQAHNWTEFYDALQNWHAPYQNFAYADINKNIGDVSAGTYPVFSMYNNSLPYSPDAIMPGNGEEFIRGYIPYQKIPQVFNPSDGIIVSSNQRQVGPSYPYWYGNTMSFSPGTRAWVVYNYLLYHNNISIQDMMNLQWNETDLAAVWSMPTIIKALENSSNPYAKTALSYLKSWNYIMSPDSKAATIWFYIYSEAYFNVFYKLFNETGFWPEFENIRPGPAGGSWPNTFGLASLDEDLIHILSTGNGTPIYNGSIDSLIVNSTISAMKLLENYYPNGNYTWGNFYGFYWPSLTGASALSVGPLSGLGGDYFTINDQSGGGGGPLPTSPGPGGQSWTFIANLKNLSNSYGVYPGGQSENPASNYYDNYIPIWIKGEYLPLIFASNPNNISQSNIIATIILNPSG